MPALSRQWTRPGPDLDARATTQADGRRIEVEVEVGQDGLLPSSLEGPQDVREAGRDGEPGRQCLIYLPEGGETTVTLDAGRYRAFWFDPRRGRSMETGHASGPAWSSPVRRSCPA